MAAHRHRRARRQDRAGGGQGRRLAAGAGRPELGGVSGGMAAAGHHPGRLHPHHRGAAPHGGAGHSAEAVGRRRDLPRQVRRPLLLRVRAVLHGKRDRRRQVSGPPDAADVHRGRELLLQDVQVSGLADRLHHDAARPDPPRALSQRDPRLPAGSAARSVEEENYFFKMSKYQGWLIDYITTRPDLIRPERYRNEILGFLRDPLQDLSISRPRRRLEWGIPLPFDDKYVTYVWFDALINYASALGWPDGERFHTFWPVVQHLIGKDILKPHAVYWPCMLKAAGLDIYQHLNVHGYWTLGGGKMSKSVGNVVEAFALSDKYGGDAFRYFVMREMTFGLDADFSEEAFVGRLNADLANDLGNLVARATTLIVNYQREAGPPAAAGPEEATIRAAAATARRVVETAMQEFAFQRALAALWEFIGVINRYVDSNQP